LATDEDPPLDPVLVVLELVPEVDVDPLLVFVAPSDEAVVSDVLPVVVGSLVVGDAVTVHDVPVLVGVATGPAVVPLLAAAGDDVVSVAAWPTVEVSAVVALVVAVEPAVDGARHAALPDELVPVADVPAPVSEVELDFVLMSPEAPLAGLNPAPPALGLWCSLGLTGIAGAAWSLASAGAVATVASTAPTTTWMPVAWAGAGRAGGRCRWWALTARPG
jgi:hypothetical protein